MIQEILFDYAKSFWYLLCEMAPYLLLGFFIAGLLQAFVPKSLMSRHLASNDWRSVVKAALFGIPLPLCSCGVIPTTAALRREGASKGAATSFLIATPQTGVDSIMATYSVLGPAFAIIRPIAALVTSFFGGILVNRLDGASGGKETAALETVAEAECKDGCCHDHGHDWHESFTGRMKSALSYGFVEMLQDVGKWLFVGLLIAALITVAVPTEFFEVFSGNTLVSMGLVLLVAIPMYLCATGSIPIAVSLMLKGLSPGTALVMLMAGPASNAASILVVRKIMGRKTLYIYLASIILGSVICGLAMDYLMPREWFALTPVGAMANGCCEESGPGFVEIASGVLLVALMANAFIFRRGHHHDHHGEEETVTAVPAFVVKVSGMTCSHCRSSVLGAVQSVAGVERADVCLNSGEVKVWGTCTAEAVMNAIDSAGFECRMA
ncbi:MAG: SO_0444 family Cu/Zn efflux transporter [Bacteroidales bacterium]|nr:SO_0444 family Cu/Zn efflux transporter [Bacteroidales bacterium]MCM1146353.1 SO_0444 family Cu/Zn efflux transporter [Bacteroidales bacterium]MCM1205209.1 SO_0444 family Cu/Zn efflux transporter [Bacillota bacterium]MCM1509706.1 SO_0444 family Cu/Zn efflux transporter [Clostridium sp.]